MTPVDKRIERNALSSPAAIDTRARRAARVVFACGCCIVSATSAHAQSESPPYSKTVYSVTQQCASTSVKVGDEMVKVPIQGEFVMTCRTITTTNKNGKVVNQEEVCSKPKFVKCAQ
jgi:hypothetical protein